MSEKLGPLAYLEREESFLAVHARPAPWRVLGEDRARDRRGGASHRHRAVRPRERASLSENLDKLDGMAKALLERETLDVEEIVAVMEGQSAARAAPHRDPELRREVPPQRQGKAQERRSSHLARVRCLRAAERGSSGRVRRAAASTWRREGTRRRGGARSGVCSTSRPTRSATAEQHCSRTPRSHTRARMLAAGRRRDRRGRRLVAAARRSCTARARSRSASETEEAARVLPVVAGLAAASCGARSRSTPPAAGGGARGDRGRCGRSSTTSRAAASDELLERGRVARRRATC